jgi:hypothetical protein
MPSTVWGTAAIDFVDDNFIGNKIARAVSSRTHRLAARDYPFEFRRKPRSIWPMIGTSANDGAANFFAVSSALKVGPGDPGRDEEETEYPAQYR